MRATPSLPDRESCKQHRILVVDDNHAIHDDFRKILNPDGAGRAFDQEEADFFGGPQTLQDQTTFELNFASQGEAALKLVVAACEAGLPYSVVFMDVRMPPGWDGIETTAKIWEVDSDIQVVICTAYSDYSWEEMIAKLGKTDRLLILKKPFEVIEVVQSAHALTSKWSLLQESHRQAEWLESTVKTRTAQLQASNARLEVEIAERSRSEEALRFTQFSVDHASDSMFRVAPDGRLLYVNSAFCRSVARTVLELRDMDVREVVPEFRDGGWERLWESMRIDPCRTLDARHVAPDGSETPVELTATLFNFDGRELLCVSSRDVSKRKVILEELSQARDAALESLRLKGHFLANMSHEIRTPMNGIIGMAELLLHTDLSHDQRDFVETIGSSADVLLNIINDILDSSKVEAGKLLFESKDFDLRELVEDTLDVVAGIAAKKNLELAGCVEPTVYPYLVGDAGRLRQVLINIISNGVKFTDVGEVILLVSPLAETEMYATVRFEIRDTGIGVSGDAKIFEPFIQADGSDTRRYGGTGLGLSICKQLVEAMGGDIGFESTPGEGTLFWFNLGFKKQKAPSRARAVSDRECITNMRVLVVDDNATNRHILRLQLGNLRMRPEAVEGSQQAMDLLRREAGGGDPFQLAVLDMQMPCMDGLQLASLIKSDPLTAPTRLLILSSLGDAFSDSALNAAGVEGYLAKPIKQTRLHRSLTSLLSGKSRSTLAMPGVLRPQDGVGEEVGLPPLRILIAEDNLVNQKVALLQLKSLGYAADLAVDGAEAVKAVQNSHYDVVLMDCQMPVMDGYAATKEIRRISERPIRIIAMTANAMQGDREKFLAAGMDDYLSKPVRTEELGRALRGCTQFIDIRAEAAQDATDDGAPPVNLDWLRDICGDDADRLCRLSNDYLEQAEEILSSIALALERSALDDVRKLAHKLAGSSGSCGMRSIVEPLKRLERTEDGSDLEPCRQLHQEAVRELARIRRFLAPYLDQAKPTAPST